MGWDAGIVGELRLQGTTFAKLAKKNASRAEVEGLSALSNEPLAPLKVEGLVTRLKAVAKAQPERVALEHEQAGDRLGIMAALDEDAFRELLPILGQLFASAAEAGGAGALTLFGIGDEEAVAHELAIVNGRAIVRPLKGPARRKLQNVRAELMQTMVMRSAPAPLPATAKRSVHPAWKHRPKFDRLDVAYRASAKPQKLLVEITTEQPHSPDDVVAVLLGFADSAEAGVFGGRLFAPSAGRAELTGEPDKWGRKSKAELELTAIEPLALRLLVDSLALPLADRGSSSLTLRGKLAPEAGAEDSVDTRKMKEWLDEPFALPRGSNEAPFDVEDLEPPKAGARILLSTSAAPGSEAVQLAVHGAFMALINTADPYGATRKAKGLQGLGTLSSPIIKKAKDGIELSFAEWSVDSEIARGLFLAAFARLHARKKISRVQFALPG